MFCALLNVHWFICLEFIVTSQFDGVSITSKSVTGATYDNPNDQPITKGSTPTSFTVYNNRIWVV